MVRGLKAIFFGSPGSGKASSVSELAAELDKPLIRIDLSTVVSKYIGENEKNLDRVFQDTAASGAVLLFDEADALFGKRTDVKEAHDRYAKIEVAYLLDRLEAFDGVAILTTNSLQNVDGAFLTRMDEVVEFSGHRRRDARTSCSAQRWLHDGSLRGRQIDFPGEVAWLRKT